MDILDILINLIQFLWDIAKLLIPIMIIIEIFKDTKLIDKISRLLRPVTRFFTLSDRSGVSLLFGVFFGVTVGAGAVMQSIKDYDVDKRSIFLIGMFISLCHAILEDSIILGAAGANILHLMLARFIGAIILTTILSRFIKEPTDTSKINEASETINIAK